MVSRQARAVALVVALAALLSSAHAARSLKDLAGTTSGGSTGGTASSGSVQTSATGTTSASGSGTSSSIRAGGVAATQASGAAAADATGDVEIESSFAGRSTGSAPSVAGSTTTLTRGAATLTQTVSAAGVGNGGSAATVASGGALDAARASVGGAGSAVAADSGAQGLAVVSAGTTVANAVVRAFQSALASATDGRVNAAQAESAGVLVDGAVQVAGAGRAAATGDGTAVNDVDFPQAAVRTASAVYTLPPAAPLRGFELVDAAGAGNLGAAAQGASSALIVLNRGVAVTGAAAGVGADTNPGGSDGAVGFASVNGAAGAGPSAVQSHFALGLASLADESLAEATGSSVFFPGVQTTSVADADADANPGGAVLACAKTAAGSLVDPECTVP